MSVLTFANKYNKLIKLLKINSRNDFACKMISELLIL